MHNRLIYKFVFSLAFLISIILSVEAAEVCKKVNDFSGFNEACVSAIVTPKNTIEIINAAEIAKVRGWNISMAGSRHSMAGQSIAPNGMYLDMRSYNKIISFDSKTRILKVQSGATWAQIQNYLDPKGMAIDVMQNFNIFTVGGSLSVNAIGWNTNSSTIASTVKSLLVLTSNGEVEYADRNTNSELFSLVLGGYGLFGVILEVELLVVPNGIYKTEHQIVDYKRFPEYFNDHLVGQDSMMQAFLSLDPDSFLDKVLVLRHTRNPLEKRVPGINDVPSNKELDNIIGDLIHVSKDNKFFRKIVWFVQKTLLPKSISLRTTRNQLMSAPLPSVLKDWTKEALILQTYFLPKNNFSHFVDKLRDSLNQFDVPVVSVSLIHTMKDETSFLSAMSEGDRFAVTLMFIQNRTVKANETMNEFSQHMIEEANNLGGSVYLAHRPSITESNLKDLYPLIDKFLILKKKYDPRGLFSNQFFEKFIR
ncbi:MAG: FAD-binding oxidoreductase [Bdellovibrionales bacterium]|nr:FAD-binding oxidoreductase [Bdellovibrionales bacterium]